MLSSKALRPGAARTMACVLIACSGNAAAQSASSPAGDWQGVLRSEERQTRSAIHLEQNEPGVLTGDIDLPDTGQWDVPLEKVTYQDGVLAFSYRGGSRSFEGRWDSAAAAWVGKFRNPAATFDVAYKAGFLGLPVLAALNGYWEADATIQGLRRRFKLRVTTNAHGTYALMDMPELVQTGLAVVSLGLQGRDVAFAVPALGMRFEGKLDRTAGSITGAFDAAGTAVPVEFRRNPSGAPRRTQTPEPPYPYTVEDVAFANPASGGAMLGCTLNVPKAPGPHPAAMLLTGSGQQDRDETLVGHKPFLVLADHLAHNGTAVLRCDDRGVGRSTGEYRTATLEDFAEDAAAGIAFLRTRREIAPSKIGLIGHSEGGVVAPMVANGRANVAFVILMAAPGVPIDELLMMQGEEVARADGVPEARIAQQRPLRRAVLTAMRDAADPDAARAAVEALLVAYGVPPKVARAQAAQEASPDILRIIRADPADAIAEMRVPVLAIVGSKDRQVPPVQNLPALREALAGHRDATVRELPGLNHLLQTAETGAMGEYYDIEETMAPLALDTIANWLGERGFTAVDNAGRSRR
ncbi:alpha/beta fold hydrolase [Sphingomonas suaedae]|uniref:Alpha/beta fold hydrolase n=2 Tax=Sphingomonas suaedae TaxID=2599297 RepID=A0A518RCU6_9SPHN|nr:alpha/beta fold hydrolase [Sphingomonas suaedae]